ncbi:MAG: hypothetical protein QNJ41_17965 [Xenococcaceae cyanobacterium MO_188.B32]|nr:hypothetical protein [Xenococcaceae cyanobacterium MO_188.B32]
MVAEKQRFSNPIIENASVITLNAVPKKKTYSNKVSNISLSGNKLSTWSITSKSKFAKFTTRQTPTTITIPGGLELEIFDIRKDTNEPGVLVQVSHFFCLERDKATRVKKFYAAKVRNSFQKTRCFYLCDRSNLHNITSRGYPIYSTIQLFGGQTGEIPIGYQLINLDFDNDPENPDVNLKAKIDATCEEYGLDYYQISESLSSKPELPKYHVIFSLPFVVWNIESFHQIHELIESIFPQADKQTTNDHLRYIFGTDGRSLLVETPGNYLNVDNLLNAANKNNLTINLKTNIKSVLNALIRFDLGIACDVDAKSNLDDSVKSLIDDLILCASTNVESGQGEREEQDERENDAIKIFNSKRPVFQDGKCQNCASTINSSYSTDTVLPHDANLSHSHSPSTPSSVSANERRLSVSNKELKRLGKVALNTLLKDSVFSKFYNGKGKLTDKETNYLVYGLYFVDYITEGSKRLRVKAFIYDIAKAQNQYYSQDRRGYPRRFKNIFRIIRSEKDKGNAITPAWLEVDGKPITLYQVIVKHKSGRSSKIEGELLKLEELDKVRGLLKEKTLADVKPDVLNLWDIPCGVGKTEWYINLIKQGESLLVAVPTHKLAKDVARRLNDEGLIREKDFIVTPNFNALPQDIVDDLKAQQELGLVSVVNELLLSKYGDRNEVKEYLSQLDNCFLFDKTVVTTHAKFLSNQDRFKHKKIIVDEDIMPSMLRSKTASLDSLKTLNDSLNLDELRKYINDLQNLALTHNNKDFDVKWLENPYDFDIKAIYPLIAENHNKYTENGLDCLLADYVVYAGSHNIGGKRIENYLFCRKVSFDTLGKQVLVMSGTPNIAMYSKEFPGLEVYKAPMVKIKGKKVQKIVAKSKTAISESELIEEIKKVNTQYILICHKYYDLAVEHAPKGVQVYKYPLVGIDTLKGGSATLMIKYLENHYSVFAKALMLGEIGSLRSQNQRVNLPDGRTCKSYLFVNDLMREIQLWTYFSVMEQTGERLRLVMDDNALLKIYSDIPLPQATIVTPNDYDGIGDNRMLIADENIKHKDTKALQLSEKLNYEASEVEKPETVTANNGSDYRDDSSESCWSLRQNGCKSNHSSYS